MREDRRPIAARGWAASAAVAEGLAGARIGANAVSLAGLGCGIGAGVAFALTSVHDGWLPWLAGAGLVLARLAANMLDGMVADRVGGTPTGELYNEIPDRLSDAATLIGLGYATGGSPALGFLAALAAVMTAYVRAVGRAATGRQDFGGPMAKQQRMAVVVLAALAAPFWSPLAPADFGNAAVALAIVLAGSVLTAALRLARIAAAMRAGSSG